MKVERVMKDIVARKKVGDRVVRELSCGHKVPEPTGGKVQLAQRAVCRVCRPGKTARGKTAQRSRR